MSDNEYTIPGWLAMELVANHPGIEIRWMDYGPRKVFVIPCDGDAFYRLPAPRLGGAVIYRRYVTDGTSLKWQLHPRTYLPTPDCVTDGRFVVFQINAQTLEPVKVFDCVMDDGTLHPMDRRVLDGILVRDGKYGAHEKAIKDVEAAPAKADRAAEKQFQEVAEEPFSRIYHDVRKHASDHAGVTADPLEDDLLINN